MWRQLSRQVSSKKFISSWNPNWLSSSCVSKNLSTSVLGNVDYSNPQNPGSGFDRFSRFMLRNEIKVQNFGGYGSPFGVCGDVRGYAAAAEAVVSTSEEDVDEIQEAIAEMVKQKEDMESKRKPVKTVGGITMGKYHILRRRQVQVETEAWQEAAREYRELLSDMCEQKLAPNLPYMKSLFLGWFEPLRDAILAEQNSYKEGTSKSLYSKHFQQLPADMMAVITMHKLLGLLMTGAGAKVLHAAFSIGEAIEQEARIHRFMEKTKRKNSLNKFKEEEAKEEDKLRKKVDGLLKKQQRHQVQKIVQQHDTVKNWGQDAQVRVGSRLIELLMETAYIQAPNDQLDCAPPDIRPAFVHALKTTETVHGTRRYGVIECDPLVRKGMEKSARHMVIPYMPMLVPPLNWTGYDRGAYLFLPSYMMRTHGAKQQRDVVKSTPKKQMEPVFQALNTLGSTKWRINKRVLDVVDRIWASGGRLADLVDRDDAPLPEEPDTEDEDEIKKWKRDIRNAKKENSEKHAQRCDIELKLSVARKMKSEDGFYYPHNLDFRGRAYPMHPHLNHLGSDLCRGILEFAEGRPLGESGIRWLKIHLANVYGGGVDKLSYDGRIAFAENHLEDVYDSADGPLEGQRWWLTAEDPFQCLATCISLSEALRSSSPETCISHIPIHQDGSCNGLQHYAALGKDRLGAIAVNLVGGEKPADVYSGIAARVLDIIRHDAAQDPDTNPNAKAARLLINQVDRKLVKQTVMTSVYGVTYVGARDQILKRLNERGLKDEPEVFSAACYAAKTTLTALGEMFEAARSIMNWLGDCAKIIAMQNKTVQWITPLGLPVVQPYRKLGKRTVKTSLQCLTLRQETEKVMVQRQKTAFPPNFVHSLDGSHMMMTAVACREAGLNFAGVHDSYWTHACDVDQMSTILRQKFVELYEAPILEDLLKSFEESFPKVKFPPLPERGDFDLKEVLDSTYFFN